jgi:hypothetical protein
MASETRLAMSQTTEKQIWKQRLKKLQDLIIYGLIEAKVRYLEVWLTIGFRRCVSTAEEVEK